MLLAIISYCIDLRMLGPFGGPFTATVDSAGAPRGSDLNFSNDVTALLLCVNRRSSAEKFCQKSITQRWSFPFSKQKSPRSLQSHPLLNSACLPPESYINTTTRKTQSLPDRNAAANNARLCTRVVI